MVVGRKIKEGVAVAAILSIQVLRNGTLEVRSGTVNVALNPTHALGTVAEARDLQSQLRTGQEVTLYLKVQKSKVKEKRKAYLEIRPGQLYRVAWSASS